MRALIEFLFVIIFMVVARAIIKSLMSGFKQASAGERTPGPAPLDTHRPGTDLHKDPMCGTYVAESARFQRLIDGKKFYYCSEKCQQTHFRATR